MSALTKLIKAVAEARLLSRDAQTASTQLGIASGRARDIRRGAQTQALSSNTIAGDMTLVVDGTLEGNMAAMQGAAQAERIAAAAAGLETIKAARIVAEANRTLETSLAAAKAAEAVALAAKNAAQAAAAGTKAASPFVPQDLLNTMVKHLDNAARQADDFANAAAQRARAAERALAEAKRAYGEAAAKLTTGVGGTGAVAVAAAPYDAFAKSYNGHLPNHPLEIAAGDAANVAITGLEVVDTVINKGINLVGAVATVGYYRTAGDDSDAVVGKVIDKTFTAGGATGEKLDKAFQRLEKQTADGVKSVNDYVSSGTWAGMY